MDTDNLINKLADAIIQVPGVSAVVLGGSRARGTHTQKSDIDLGIYYHPDRPLDLSNFSRVAADFDDTHRPDVLTPPGGWGPWINGGGWLTVRGTPVDFIYRDLSKVSNIIADCHAGTVDIVYQPGHPFGFTTSIYMGEVAVCKVLRESERGELLALKAQTTPYSAALKKGIIAKFGWEVNFSLEIARKAIPRGDLSYATGACFRGVNCMLQVLFALNSEYWLNEKGALALADGFPICPAELKARAEPAFDALPTEGQSIAAAIDILDELSAETDALVQVNPA